ncbi:MAG: DUF1957 domain-containing protein [Elusimicrobia bacterium]|nr:DUF1957 domain-containing protein [Elusimicrobiota bacterium]
MKNANGGFCFILHSHIPYVKKAGTWPFGEEWLLEGLLETYIPLLDVFYELKENNIPYKATIDITPVLIEQLADEYFIKRFEEFVSEKIKRAEFDIEKFSARHQSDYKCLAEFYRNIFVKILDNFKNKYQRNIIAAFKKLQDDNNIEIMTSAATNGYLPLLSCDSSIYAQLKIGIDTYKKHFDRKPKGVWLPECAYRQGKNVQAGNKESYRSPSLDKFLCDLGVEYFIVDSSGIECGQAFCENKKIEQTTLLPYLTRDGVAVFGRDKETGQLVWSSEHGYPADGKYREFYKNDYDSGLQYWRVTSTKVDLGLKEIYNLKNVSEKIKEDAGHFSNVVERKLDEFNKKNGDYGMITAPYDAELFGHWWFEGIEWLKQVLIKISQNPKVSLLTPSEYLQEHKPKCVAEIAESSWGEDSNHYMWLNPETKWMWPYIHDAELQMEDVVQIFKNNNIPANTLRTLKQAARELLLLQSSDWAFLITTKQAKEYATERFLLHFNRFCRLAAAIEEQGIETNEFLTFLKETENIDTVFSEIDFRDFAKVVIKD